MRLVEAPFWELQKKKTKIEADDTSATHVCWEWKLTEVITSYKLTIISISNNSLLFTDDEPCRTIQAIMTHKYF